jgi:1-acyl-sn-glycerol-3-phosphate acyltransferase
VAWEIKRGLIGCAEAVFSGLLIIYAVITALLTGAATTVIGLFSPGFSRRLARLWSVLLLFFTKVKLSVRGLENIEAEKNYVFIANHQGYYDIPVLYAGLGSSISFIAKKELFSIPFFGWGIASIGCIRMDRKNPRKARESISIAVSMLRKNHMSLVLFPEGTRSVSGAVGEFKRGSFTLALEAGIPVVPIAICGTNRIHKKSSFIVRSASVDLIVGRPIAAEELKKMDKEQLSETMHKVIVGLVEKTPK